MMISFLSFFSASFLFLVYSSSRLLLNVVFGIFVLYFLVPRRSAFLQLHSARGLVGQLNHSWRIRLSRTLPAPQNEEFQWEGSCQWAWNWKDLVNPSLS